MSKSTKWFRYIIAAAGIAALAMLAAACGGTPAATTGAMCAFRIGNGQNGNDSNVHAVYYPNQQIRYNGDREEIKYVPCNSRNYYINASGQKTAAGNVIGDRHNPTLAYTSDGTEVKVWSHALWTLNETTTVMSQKFWPVCLKYNCASSSSSGGNSNFSTVGWNGMLGEVFGPSQDRAIRQVINGYGDAIWQDPQQTTWTKIGDAASNNFAAAVQLEVGYADKIFCGSGNSGWANPAKPGVGEFTCQPVRIIIDGIQPVSTKLANQVQSSSLNKSRLTKAKDLYGSEAQYWLGLQDTISQCQNTKVTCVFNIGNSGSIPVSVGK